MLVLVFSCGSRNKDPAGILGNFFLFSGCFVVEKAKSDEDKSLERILSLLSVKDKIAVILNFFVDCLKFYGILLF